MRTPRRRRSCQGAGDWGRRTSRCLSYRTRVHPTLMGMGCRERFYLTVFFSDCWWTSKTLQMSSNNGLQRKVSFRDCTCASRFGWRWQHYNKQRLQNFYEKIMKKQNLFRVSLVPPRSPSSTCASNPGTLNGRRKDSRSHFPFKKWLIGDLKPTERTTGLILPLKR